MSRVHTRPRILLPISPDSVIGIPEKPRVVLIARTSPTCVCVCLCERERARARARASVYRGVDAEGERIVDKAVLVGLDPTHLNSHKLEPLTHAACVMHSRFLMTFEHVCVCTRRASAVFSADVCVCLLSGCV